jgi:hypothetical protein
MANEKISQMPLISTFASGDLFPIVDISEASAADRNKSVTFGELFRNVLGGSASDPSIAFTGDQNTGIYSPGADQVAVATNGTGRLFVDASGNVGLKVAAPSFVAGYTGLQADGGGNGSVIKLTNSTTGSTSADGFDLILQQGGSDAYVWQRESAPLIFGTAATERLRITSAGLVGIGTSAPGALLSVETNSATSAIGFAGRFYDTATNRGFGAPLLYVRTPNDTASASSIGMFGVGDNADTSELGNLFRITQTGQVGIGTTSPSRLLHLSSASDVYIQVDRGSITSLFGTDKAAGIYFGIGTNGEAAITATETTDGETSLVFGTRGGGTRSERARLDHAGRLLVGTSSTSKDFSAVFQGNSADATGGANLLLARGTSSPADGSAIGYLSFTDSNHNTTAQIQAQRDGGTWTSGTSQPGRLVFSTTSDGASSPTERLRIDSSGRVGIGVTTVEAPLHVAAANGAPLIRGSASTGTNACYMQLENTAGGVLVGRDNSSGGILGGGAYASHLWAQGAYPLVFSTNSTQRAQIDSSGRLLVGTSSARSGFQISTGFGNVTPVHQFEYNSQTYNGLSITHNAGANTYPAVLAFGKSRGSSAGSYTAVAGGDGLGWLNFYGADGTKMVLAATISAEVDGTPGADDMPGRLVFSTTEDGESSPTARMRIDSNGTVFIGKTVNDFTTEGVQIRQSAATTGFVTGGGTVATFSRTSNDGTIISLRQDGIEEGSISVSGTTVSYNGAHLSRWSQITGIDPYNKAVRPEILRGTVMSNLDEMCDWTCPESGECQDNEQLNKTKVSDVEGDKNVAGIFQSLGR